MTALVGYVYRQIDRTRHSPRHLRVLMAVLVIIIAAGVALMLQR